MLRYMTIYSFTVLSLLQFRAYHRQDLCELTFYDMVTFALVGINALYIEEGDYTSTCLVSPLSHGLRHLV
jgi:hypothetical protein